MKKDVSIIIVNYKTPDLTISAVNAVRAAVKDTIKYEVIVVDNYSPDNSFEKIANLRNENTIIIRTDYNGGFGYGNNVGANLAIGNYLFFLNSDTLMRDSVLEKMVHYLDANPDVGILSCQMVDGDNNPLVSGHAFESVSSLFIQTIVKPCIPLWVQNWRGRITHRKRKNVVFKADWVSGAALLIKKDIFHKVGGWSKDYFMYMEDEDLCLQVRNEGYDVCVYNEVGLTHLVGQSGGSEFVAEEKFKSAVKYFSKTHKGQLRFIKVLLFIQAWFYLKKLTVREKICFIKRISDF